MQASWKQREGEKRRHNNRENHSTSQSYQKMCVCVCVCVCVCGGECVSHVRARWESSKHVQYVCVFLFKKQHKLFFVFFNDILVQCVCVCQKVGCGVVCRVECFCRTTGK